MWSFQWKMKGFTLKALRNANHGEQFDSPTLFTCMDAKFKIRIYPKSYYHSNSGNIELKIVADDAKFTILDILMVISFVEPNKSTTQTAKISYGASGIIRLTDAPASILDKHDVITIKVEAEVQSATDGHGNDITHLYTNEEMKESQKQGISKTDPPNNSLQPAKLDSMILQIQSLSKEVENIKNRLNDLELKINEEQKVNNDDKIELMMKEIKSIKHNVTQLSLTSNINPTQDELTKWLTNKVGLPQYYDKFVENGIDDMDTVKLLTMNTIKAMGIDKIGHQMKLLNQVVKLKQHSTNNEGGTAYI